MGKRKKLKKALISKSKVLEEHEEKLQKVIGEGNEYLIGYYQKEIRAKKADREKTMKQILRKKKDKTCEMF